MSALRPSLDGCVARLKRADSHLDELQRIEQVFRDARPYKYTVDLYPDAPDFRIQITQVNDPPAHEWAPTIGDVAHNLRSTLDHLVWQLAILDSGAEPPIPEQSSFPIWESDTTRNGTLRDITTHPHLALLSTPHRKTIRDLQPYQRRHDPRSHELWQLDQLSNIDKHRVPHLVNVRLTETVVTLAEEYGQLQNIVTRGSTELGPEVASGRLISAYPDAKDKIKVQLTPDIRFGDREPDLAGRPLLDTLRNIRAYVEDQVIGRFRADLR